MGSTPTISSKLRTSVLGYSVRMERFHRKSVEEWLQTPWEQLGEGRKRWIVLHEANHTCSQCGFDKHRDDGYHVVEVDHIDGDHQNNAKSNLRVLCPNCHALTPNFRNYGRTSASKTSTRFRRENKGYAESMKLIKQQEREYVERFKSIVMKTHISGEIDFSKYGWVQRLSEKLNDKWPQAVARRVRKLMPEFYVNSCHFRSKKRLLDQKP